MASLEIFGDSITYGLGDPEGGWAERVRRTMLARMEDYSTTTGYDIKYNSERRGIPTFVNAEPGMVLPDMVASLPHIFQRRARNPRIKGRLILATMAGFSEHAAYYYEPNVSLYRFEASLLGFDKKLKDSPYDVVRLFVELPPFDFTRPRPLNQHNLRLDRLAAYQQVVKDHASETGALYLPIAQTLRQLPEDPLGRDGIHPGPIGHAAIHDIVLDKLDEILGPRAN